MGAWVGSLLAGIVEALFGWLMKRKAASDQVKQAEHQATVEAGESTVRDRTAQKVAADREKSSADLDRAGADAGGAGGLRKQSVDIAAAIDDANREVR